MTTSDFEPITESGPLVRELRARIERDGPITFHDFMEAALYHEKYGYYTTTEGATSRGGDFVTSPEVHPIFGTLVAKTLLELWESMDRPTRFDVVEQGAGSGLLARDILRWAHEREPEFAAALRYTLVERSPPMLASQQRVLAELDVSPGIVAWAESPPGDIIGVVLSNELVDAFPAHRVVRRGDELREVFVAHDRERFVDELRPLSSPALGQYFDTLDLLPGEGSYAEVNLDAIDWMRDVAASLSRGYVLTFDYGYEAADLYAPWRKDGTLLCFSKQSASSDPYQRIGKQDMTSSVDFTTLKRIGEEVGLETLAMTDQSSFLVRMGIGEGVAEVQGEMEEYFARRKVVMDLIDPARLGRIKVLLQGTGVNRQLPKAFTTEAEATHTAVMRNRSDAAPILRELWALGFPVASIGTLYREKHDYRSAIPCLIKWLPVTKNPDVKFSIILALSTKWARPAAAAPLVAEFRLAPQESAGDVRKKWQIGEALRVVSDDSAFEDLVDLLTDVRHGEARGMLPLALCNMETYRDQAVEVLMSLLGDKWTTPMTIRALKKLRAVQATSLIAPFEHDADAWTRNEAKQAIASLDKQLKTQSQPTT